ncbi:MAG: DRTGG domain-containing protein [Bacillota bacterium]
MKVSQLATALNLQLENGGSLDRQVTGAYCSDMLSDVMANGREGQLWITVQTHQNVAAVATLMSLCAVIVTGGKRPSKELLAKAEDEAVPVLTTGLTTFEVAGRIYNLLRQKE